MIKEFENLEAKAGLPPGWDMKKIGLFRSGDRDTWDAAFLGLPTVSIGWLLTAMALSLGASFWLNLLDIRGCAEPPSKRPRHPAAASRARPVPTAKPGNRGR